MKGIVIYTKWLVPPGYNGITLWPFIIIDKRENGTPETLNHEQIHIQQQTEMLVIPFYIAYILMFLANLVMMKSNPYRSIPFEKEAYEHQDNPVYLKTRKFWAWLRHF